MRAWQSILAIFVTLTASWAADQPAAVPLNCATGLPGGPACVVTPESRKEAKRAFARGVKLEKAKRLEEALPELEKAADLVPQDIQYVTLREMVRQELVYEHTQRGNDALANGQQVQAMGEFRSALHLDPTSDFARQRLTDSLGPSAPQVRQPPRVVAESNVIRFVPKDQLQSFHFRGDSRMLLTQIANAYGVVATFDDSVLSRQLRFDLENVDFYTAMRLAGIVTKTFWSPLEEKQVLVAAESAENHRLFDRMGMRTFYVPDASTPTELTDLVNVLRTLFELKFVTSEPQNSTIAVRAPQNVLEPASRFMEELGSGHPEVMLDVRVFEVSRTLINNFGLQIPNQFNLYNIPVAALGLTLAGGQSIQSLINQLIASGGINQANSTALSALLAQIGGNTSSIFSQPLATFGNGLTLMGVSLGTLSATLSTSQGNLRSLQHVTLRAAQGKDATINLGTRYPIVNATFAPIFNTSAISSAIQNNSFIAPIPSFTYEDLGMTLKVKPYIHGESDVSLTVDMKVRSLSGASVNGQPVIGNREYTGSINVKNEQAAVVAGEISSTEQRSLSGIPGVGQFPVLNRAVATNTKEKDSSEFLVVITPHIISLAETPDSMIWMTGIK
jgi:hypothetical protein